MTQDEVIHAFRAKHGQKYDYSLVEYRNSMSPVVIICTDHGPFQQRPGKHIFGQACPACADASRNESKRLTWDVFIQKAQQVHGDRYLYSQPCTTMSGQCRLKIVCPAHGLFHQAAEKHLQGQGCTQCSLKSRGIRARKSLEDFIIEARRVHGDTYSYDESVYEGARKHLTITCPNHGDFRQMPTNHLGRKGHEGTRCPSCATPGRRSRRASQWLDELGVVIREYRVTEQRRLTLDGFDPITNTAYLFHGDYWHGNPAVYGCSEINSHNGKTFGELYKKTVAIEHALVSYGYKIVTIWESDWVASKKARPETPQSGQ